MIFILTKILFILFLIGCLYQSPIVREFVVRHIPEITQRFMDSSLATIQQRPSISEYGKMLSSTSVKSLHKDNDSLSTEADSDGESNMLLLDSNGNKETSNVNTTMEVFRRYEKTSASNATMESLMQVAVIFGVALAIKALVIIISWIISKNKPHKDVERKES